MLLGNPPGAPALRAYLATASLQYRHLRLQSWVLSGAVQDSLGVPLPSVAWSDTLVAKFGTMCWKASSQPPGTLDGLLWDT